MREEVKKIANYRLEGARLIFKNFSGKETQYNAAGNRNFALVIPEEDFEMLKGDGWNVKCKTARDEEEADLLYLPVKVKYGKIPPIVTMITSRGKIRVDEDMIGQLDWALFRNVDIVVRPYQYPAMPNRPAGVSAYLKSLYVEIEEDDFEAKYADLPDLN